MGNGTVTNIAPKSGEVLPPPAKKYKCPFYGMMGLPGVLMGQGGNACALTFEHSPCSMETAGETPCWDKCTRWNHEDNHEKVAKLLETFNAFPDEFRPNGSTAWEGINAMAWFRHVMGHEYP